MVAVPAAVNCAVPTIAALSQWVASVLQKVTVPAVTGKPPVFEVAVSVTAVPRATVAEESDSVVVAVSVTTRLTVAVAAV